MATFLKEVADSLVEKLDADLQHSAIVFNNKRPAAYLHKHLADIIGKPFFAPSVFTIQDFFGEAVEEKIADPYIQLFTLHKIYNELLLKEGIAPINSSHFYPLAKVILSDFSQIDNDLVDAATLYKELEDISAINLEFDFLTPEQYNFLSRFWSSYSEGKHKQKQEDFIRMWRRMPGLYEGFHAALAEQNYITYGGAYRKLASADLSKIGFINQFKKVVFIGFNALTRAEAALFARLRDAGKAWFYFDSDSYYFDDPLQEAGLFLRKNINQLQLKNELEPSASRMTAMPHQVDVYKVQGHAAQAKILKQLLEKNTGSGDSENSTAIILADESLLIPALQSIPYQVAGKNINLNVTMGFPLAASSVFGLADLWLDCQLEMVTGKKKDNQGTLLSFISCKHLESFLTHPLIGLSQEMKNKIRSAILAENVLLIEQKRIIRQGGLLEHFFKEIPQPTGLMEGLAELLVEVWKDLSARKILKEMDARLFAGAIQNLNRLQDSIGNYMDGEEHYFVASLMRKVLQSVNISLSGEPLEGVQLMGLLETRNLNFDQVIFLGFNEGIIPKTSIGNSFIPDSIRRVYGLPVLENLDAISAYMVYRLLQRAKNITIVYNNLTDETTNGEPSRLLRQLEYESGFQFNYYSLDLNVQSTRPAKLTIDKKHPRIQEKLQHLLHGQKTLSPTAITTYIANPIDFFFSYIADIKEPKELTAEVEPKELGSILHEAMDQFYRTMKGKTVTKEWLTLSRSSNETLIKKSFYKIRAPKNTESYEFSGMQTVILAIVKAYMDIILNEDENYAPFKIIGLEEKINSEIDFELNDSHHSISIKGVIDRIDEKEGITRIVDYKTGNDQLRFAEDITQLFATDGKNINKALIQTMIYTRAYEKLKEKQHVQPVLYVVRNMKNAGILFNTSKNQLDGDFLSTFKPLFEKQLALKLAELFDETIPFRASEVPENYSYSPYKTLFGS